MEFRAEDHPDPLDIEFLETRVPEKTTEKTASMPSQNTAVATADGNKTRHAILPASKNHIVNHQKPVNTTRPMTASSTGPRRHGARARPGLPATSSPPPQPARPAHGPCS